MYMYLPTNWYSKESRGKGKGGGNGCKVREVQEERRTYIGRYIN